MSSEPCLPDPGVLLEVCRHMWSVTHALGMQVNVQESGAAKSEAQSTPADAAALADAPLPAPANGTAK